MYLFAISLSTLSVSQNIAYCVGWFMKGIWK